VDTKLNQNIQKQGTLSDWHDRTYRKQASSFLLDMRRGKRGKEVPVSFAGQQIFSSVRASNFFDEIWHESMPEAMLKATFLA
jgi:hypothetical protein